MNNKTKTIIENIMMVVDIEFVTFVMSNDSKKFKDVKYAFLLRLPSLSVQNSLLNKSDISDIRSFLRDKTAIEYLTFQHIFDNITAMIFLSYIKLNKVK